jgi:hypothetical protein
LGVLFFGTEVEKKEEKGAKTGYEEEKEQTEEWQKEEREGIGQE